MAVTVARHPAMGVAVRPRVGVTGARIVGSPSKRRTEGRSRINRRDCEAVRRRALDALGMLNHANQCEQERIHAREVEARVTDELPKLVAKPSNLRVKHAVGGNAHDDVAFFDRLFGDDSAVGLAGNAVHLDRNVNRLEGRSGSEPLEEAVAAHIPRDVSIDGLERSL